MGQGVSTSLLDVIVQPHHSIIVQYPLLIGSHYFINPGRQNWMLSPALSIMCIAVAELSCTSLCLRQQKTPNMEDLSPRYFCTRDYCGASNLHVAWEMQPNLSNFSHSSYFLFSVVVNKERWSSLLLLNFGAIDMSWSRT